MVKSKPPALIVAHGQPSDPAPAGRALDALAAEVGQIDKNRAVKAATLAEPDALAAAIAALGPSGVVYPMFMAGGWFTRVALVEKLRNAGAQIGPDGWQVLEPFGCDTAVHDLARDVLAEALTGQALADAEVLIAAHGSFKSSAPSDVAFALARRVKYDLSVARVGVGFIDQNPRLAEANGFGAGAICLPFFAAIGGHVTDDIPRALAEAGFGGRVLPPLGTDFRVPQLIADSLNSLQFVCSQSCRYSQSADPMAAQDTGASQT
jgi:sirohydrochlorin ferrochelatase